MENSALETARLLLRGVTEADAPACQRNFADYAVIGELAGNVPWPYPDDGALSFIRGQVLPHQGAGRWVWGLFLKTAPAEMIGNVDLWRTEPMADGDKLYPGRRENRGFWLGRRFWGRGLMTEATEVVTDHAFDVLGFERLILCNALGNCRSRRIKEKAGARLLRVEPGRFVNPAYTQREVWELTRADWQNRPSAPAPL